MRRVEEVERTIALLEDAERRLNLAALHHRFASEGWPPGTGKTQGSGSRRPFQ